jgi:uncharacterized protein
MRIRVPWCIVESCLYLFFPLVVFQDLPVASALEIPPNDGFVTDAAGVLSPEEETAIEQVLDAYRLNTTNEIAVLIVPSLSGAVIADTAVEVLRTWGVGVEGKDNGVVLLIAYADREAFVATGYGFEGVLPDLVVRGILEKDMQPLFREGEYAKGIAAGVDALQKHIGGEFTAERYVAPDDGNAFGWSVFLFFLVVDYCSAAFARTKSWWLGGIVGGVFGAVLWIALLHWWFLPLMAGLGLLFDYILSRRGPNARGMRVYPGTIGAGRGGGFRGFHGGSGGGGGAGMKW